VQSGETPNDKKRNTSKTIDPRNGDEQIERPNKPTDSAPTRSSIRLPSPNASRSKTLEQTEDPKSNNPTRPGKSPVPRDHRINHLHEPARAQETNQIPGTKIPRTATLNPTTPPPKRSGIARSVHPQSTRRDGRRGGGAHRGQEARRRDDRRSQTSIAPPSLA